jgi:hypothetical protein
MIDGWLGGLEKDGVPNARVIYTQAQALVSRFENG